jgi:hypothetical protein
MKLKIIWIEPVFFLFFGALLRLYNITIDTKMIHPPRILDATALNTVNLGD